MGTWATWTFTRFERVKVRVYSTCEQGFGSLPHTGYNVAYFPAMEDGHEAKQGRKGTVRYSFLWVVRFRCSTCCHGCQFSSFAPPPWGSYTGPIFLDPPTEGSIVIRTDLNLTVVVCAVPVQGVYKWRGRQVVRGRRAWQP